MKMIIGLDGHSKTSSYAAQDGRGKVIGEGQVPSSYEGLGEMVKKLVAPVGTQVVMETGPSTDFLSRICWSLGLEPVVIHAQEVRALARRKRQKSDRRDAFDLCDGWRRGIFTMVVYQPDPDVRRLRRVNSRRRFFVKECSRQIHSVKFQLRQEGLAELCKSLGTEVAWDKLLADPRVESLRAYIEMHARMWTQAQQHVEALDKELDEAMKPYEAIETLLCSVPGVGRVTAASFVAALGRVDRFDNSGQVASYLGLVPSSHDSGEVVRHGSITKAGCPPLRSVLCECAHHAGRPDHPLNPYFRRVCAKSGYKKAAVAVAHRLARILFQLWRKGEAFDVEKLNVVRDRQKRTRTYEYRMKSEARPSAGA